MSALEDVLAAAKNAAPGTAVAAIAQTPALTQTGGAVTSFSTSEDAFLNAGGMTVDTYINVTPFGIRLNKEWGGQLDSFEATIDMNDVKFFWGVQKTIGKSVEYAKSYDGVSTIKGENFQNVIGDFQRLSDKKADPYPGADLPFNLANDYADPKDAKKVYNADQVAGWTTSITGFKPWQAFHKKIKAAGLGTSVLKLKVSHAPRKNNAGQEYGVLEFDLLEIVQDNRPAA